MHFSFICSLIVLVASSMAEPEPEPFYQYNFAPIQYPLFRSGLPYSSMVDTAVDSQGEGRFYFATVTLTLSTLTSTSTSTVTTTCTTTTAALSSCVAGRRRRFANGSQGLFYDEESSIFLPFPAQPVEKPAEAPVDEQSRIVRQSAPVPAFIQPGFGVPDQIRGGRFLLAFATSTTTTTVTTTSTTQLIAICSSTTLYNACASG